MVAKTKTEETALDQPKRLAKATSAFIDDSMGSFFMPGHLDSVYQTLGLTPEKLIIPKDYHAVIRMCYDFYQRGGSVSRVVDRMQEFSITEIRNGQRNTTDEQNAYFEAVLHNKPSRLMRHLRRMALEYYLSGMVLPRVQWKEVLGKDLSPKLTANKKYMVPTFDNYPPLLVHVKWINWGTKGYFLKVPPEDIKAVRSKGGKIKEQQLKYKMWLDNFPGFVQQIQAGGDFIEITDSDPILRKELSITPYPTPYLFNVLESLVFKQQLRRMDFATASRVITAILLVKEGSDAFPLTEETQYLLDNLQTQMMARTGDARKQERLFQLFTDHTTTMEWIHPDVEAMLNQDKYRQVNEELDEGLGFPGVLLTGNARQGGEASEVSTWAIQAQMDEVRSMFIEWVSSQVYIPATEMNHFRNTPDPSFKPVKLQDLVKTAAVFQALFAEGNISRSTRDDMAGLNFETETELMKDEQQLAEGLPAFAPTPYSPPPPEMGKPTAGRPAGKANPPVNKRRGGVTSKGKAETEEWSDELFIQKLNEYAEKRGIIITPKDISPEL